MVCLIYRVVLYLPEDTSNLIEVMVSSNSSLEGKTIEEVWFNRKYDATVLTLHRDGHQIINNLATTPLKRGDTLLLLAGFGFKKIWQDSQEFLSVSVIDERRFIRKNSNYKPYVCLGIIAAMVLLPAFNVIPILYTALMSVFAFLILEYLPWKSVVSYIDWKTIIVVASSFGISIALSQSGASKLLADAILDFTRSFGNIGILITIFLVTNLLTEVITNNAAVALVYPIALSLASAAGVNPTPLVMTVAIASSSSFATPIGYQTNMLVYGPGGYKYVDYLKVGLPLNLIFMVITCFIVPKIWSF